MLHIASYSGRVSSFLAAPNNVAADFLVVFDHDRHGFLAVVRLFGPPSSLSAVASSLADSLSSVAGPSLAAGLSFVAGPSLADLPLSVAGPSLADSLSSVAGPSLADLLSFVAGPSLHAGL